MFIGMSTTFSNWGELKEALKNFPDDTPIDIDSCVMGAMDEKVDPDKLYLVYETRCDDVPRIYLSYLVLEE